MRTLRFLLPAPAALIVCAVALAQAPAPLLDKDGNPAGFRTLAIGDRAPDFELPGIDGRHHRLSDYSDPDVLMILFTSNHCPTTHAMNDRLAKLIDSVRGRSFGLIAINPNHPEGLTIDELGYGEFNDSFEEMKPYAQKHGWKFPYLYDGDKQLTARAYGCLATPHVFIFDKQRTLRYAGRFDDSRYADESTVTSHDARNAIEAMLAGQPVPVEMTRPHGCSTKWREKHTKNVAAQTAWTKIPVTVERIDATGIAALRANASGNYRLINVWATWCAPCVEEFPALVALSRKFDRRDFEVVTISLDDPKNESKAQAFLQKQGAGLTKRRQEAATKQGRKTNHFIYAGGSQDALAAALDPAWPGPIPHTVLIAPGGKIVWRQNGVFDSATAIAAIVKAMGEVYVPPKSE